MEWVRGVGVGVGDTGSVLGDTVRGRVAVTVRGKVWVGVRYG